MQVVYKPDTDVYVAVVFAMRHSGATLQQIADKLNRTKERVRQILIEHYGSTDHGLISTEQLRKQLGLSRQRIMDLYRISVITPERKWTTNGISHLLWSREAVKKADTYLNSCRLCKICHRPVPRGRRVFCSDECYQEDHKYKNKSAVGKQRHLESVRKYRKKLRILQYAGAVE